MVLHAIVAARVGSVHAAPGDLDVTFSGDGKILETSLASARANARIGLARYDSTGTLDPAFLFHGIVDTEFPVSGGGAALGVAMKADGRIVVVGSTGADFAVSRFNADGSIDTTFGPPPGGIATRDFGSNTESATAVAIQSDGRILVAGSTIIADRQVFAWDRFSTTGFAEFLGTNVVDNSANHTSFGGCCNARANSMVIQPDGRILLVGDFNIQSGGGQLPTTISDHAIARYNTDGTMDTTFDANGSRTIDFGVSASASEVAIQPDAKIVVAGHATTSGFPIDFALARLNASGSLDTGFSGDGRLTTDFSSGATITNDFGSAVTIQRSDGRIVVAGSAGGYSGGGAAPLVALARYHPSQEVPATPSATALATTRCSAVPATIPWSPSWARTLLTAATAPTTYVWGAAHCSIRSTLSTSAR